MNFKVGAASIWSSRSALEASNSATKVSFGSYHQRFNWQHSCLIWEIFIFFITFYRPWHNEQISFHLISSSNLISLPQKEE